ncbi:MAG: 4Fe-4S binding protein [Anaerolineae bacterium]|nr:4Fe-4S binding protein [Anaerolineae bacterium]
MADLSVPRLGLANPFIIAASPATQGVYAVLKSAAVRPGAVVMRNYRHAAGGGTLLSPSAADMRAGRHATQSHALGTQMRDAFNSHQEYYEGVAQARRQMPAEVKLWVSVGHFADTITPGVDWKKDWTEQAVELERAGADALEVHFNTPGVAVAGDRVHDFYRLIYNTTRMVKGVTHLPVMVKLPLESTDPLRAMEAAWHAGADAVGPTARWKAFVFELDWRRSLAQPGGGYGGTQALPIICYAVAEARLQGIDIPMYAGGGVFSWEAAAKLIMAGSDAVQLGSLACCLGPGAVQNLMQGFSLWMDQAGHPDVASLRGEALSLLTMPAEVAEERRRRLGAAYRQAGVREQLCDGCGYCADACWYDAIHVKDGKAAKTAKCIGCGYCFQVCPTGALYLPEAGDIVASVFHSQGS